MTLTKYNYITGTTEGERKDNNNKGTVVTPWPLKGSNKYNFIISFKIFMHLIFTKSSVLHKPLALKNAFSAIAFPLNALH